MNVTETWMLIKTFCWSQVINKQWCDDFWPQVYNKSWFYVKWIGLHTEISQHPYKLSNHSHITSLYYAIFMACFVHIYLQKFTVSGYFLFHYHLNNHWACYMISSMLYLFDYDIAYYSHMDVIVGNHGNKTLRETRPWPAKNTYSAKK